MQARFALIKSHILQKIERQELQPGAQVPSENQLAEEFSVSRMTARRALSELVDEGLLQRSQGTGTFVADSRPMSSMLEIRSIDDEIKQRGHHYSNRVLTQYAIEPNAAQAGWFEMPSGSKLFHSRIVHYENGQAIQLEDRLVNPLLAPDYLEQDFQQTTPNHYLSQVAPLMEADHLVEAILPDTASAGILQISNSQPCLLVTRRTYSAQGMVSFAKLIHPGQRFRLGGHLDFSQKNRTTV